MSRWSLAFVCSTLLLVAVPRVGGAPLTVDYVDAVTGSEWAGLDQTEAISWSEVAAVCSQDGTTPCSANIGICPESCRKALWRDAPAERLLTLPPYAA